MIIIIVILLISGFTGPTEALRSPHLTDSFTATQLDKGFTLLSFGFNVTYESSRICVDKLGRFDQCLNRYAYMPVGHIDSLSSGQLSAYRIDVTRGMWDDARWGHIYGGVAPGGVTMMGRFRSGSDVGRHPESWLELREKTLSKYGVAVLRDTALYKPFQVHVAGKPILHRADVNLGRYNHDNDAARNEETMWVQHVPGDESGGSGSGGMCTDTAHPAAWLDPIWMHEGGTPARAIAALPFKWLLSKVPYSSSSVEVSLKRYDCALLAQNPQTLKSHHCSIVVEVINTFKLVVHKKDDKSTPNLLKDLMHEIENRTHSNRNSAGNRNVGVTLTRYVVDSKDLDVHFLTVINNTETDSAERVDLIVTDVMPIHVYIPLSRYVYQYICGVHISEINEKCIATNDQTLSIHFAVDHCRVMDRWLGPHNSQFEGSSRTISSSFPLPSNCSLVLRVTGKKRFLNRETMPGDASRGIEVPPVVVEVQKLSQPELRNTPSDDHARNSRKYTLISEAVLISVPIPDASMPFNVLTLVSTVAAFLLGSVLSGTVRKSQRKASSSDMATMKIASTPPSGFTIIPSCISKSIEANLLSWLDSTKELPWERAAEGRRVIQFGPSRFDYIKQSVVESPHTPEIPDILKEFFFPFIPAEHREGLVQCIINDYMSEDGIPYHVDDLSFGEHIYVFSVGSARPLCFRRLLIADGASGNSSISGPKEGAPCNPLYEQWVAQAADTDRCMYHLCGEVRYQWEHSVLPAKGMNKDSADSNRRVSVTFRSIVKSKS